MNIAEIAAREREEKRAELAKTPLNMVAYASEYECCSKAFRKAERAKTLNGKQWDCPECGQRWLMELKDGVRHWTPQAEEIKFLR